MSLVSICIPTRNRAERLRSALEHVVGFTTFEYEVVISDNCSDDDTQAVVESFRSRFERLYYLRQDEPLSFFRTQQPPFNLAVGDYLVYLADDDRLVEEGVAAAVDVLDREPGLAVVYGGWERVSGDHKQMIEQHQLCAEQRRITLASLAQQFGETYAVEMPVLRRTAYEAALTPLNDQYAFDLSGLARMLAYGDAIMLPCVIHRVAQHEGQASRALYRDDILSCYLADYELAAGMLPDLTPLERAWFVSRKITLQYLCAASRAYEHHQFLRARTLVQRAMAVRPDLATKLAVQMDDDGWAFMVAESVLQFTRSAPPVNRIVIEATPDGETVALALCELNCGLEIKIGTCDDLMFVPYQQDEFFLFTSDHIVSIREAIGRQTIRKRRSLPALRAAVRVAPNGAQDEPCQAASL